MKFKISIAIFALVLSVFSLVSVKKSHAFSEIGTGYIVANFNSLVTTFLLSLPSDERDVQFLDGYARLFECDLVKKYFDNEFEWQQIREVMNTKIDKLDREYFSYYEFGGSVDLEKYDFDKETFPATEESVLTGIRLLNMFKLGAQAQRGKKNCSEAFVKHQRFISSHLPTIFSVKVLSPITFKQLPMDAEQAKKFVTVAEENKDKTRKIYIRFRVKLDAVADVRKRSSQQEVIFHGELFSADAFLDKNFTKHVAELKL